MPESGTYGSVRGALSNGRPYRDRCACGAPAATVDNAPLRGLRCPPPQPSTTCPQPSTTDVSKLECQPRYRAIVATSGPAQRRLLPCSTPNLLQS